MSLDLTAASGVLKEFYLPQLQEQLNDDVGPTMAQLERSSRQVVGLEVVGSAHTRRSVGTGSRGEFDDLPTAGNQQYTKYRSDLKYHYGRAQFTGQVMARAKADKGAFVDAATREMDRLASDLGQVQARQLWNDAEGALAPVSGAATGQVVPIANATNTQIRSLIVGMTVDIGTTGVQADEATAVVISSVDRVNKTVTFTGNVTGVTAAGFIRMVNSFGHELTGLQALVNEQDTVQSIDGTSVEVWNSYVNDNSGTPRSISEILLQTVLDEIHIESGETPDLVVTDHGIYRNYGAVLNSQKRFVNEQDLKGGHKGLYIDSGMQGAALVADRFAPEGKVYFLNTGDIVMNEASDWEWMDEDGSILNRIPNKDAYEATMFKYCELTIDRRNTHGVLEDITS